MAKGKVALGVKVLGVVGLVVGLSARVPLFGVYQDNIVSKEVLYTAAETGGSRLFNCAPDQMAVSYIGPSKEFREYGFFSSILAFHFNVLFAVDNPIYWKIFKGPLTYIGHHNYRVNTGSLFRIGGCGLRGRLFCRYGVPLDSQYGCNNVTFDRAAIQEDI